jgi:hypothetical protein
LLRYDSIEQTDTSHGAQIWAMNQSSSVAEIDLKANVCSVKYNPVNQHELAVGSADHNVLLFDTRRCGTPLRVFSGEMAPTSCDAMQRYKMNLTRFGLIWRILKFVFDLHSDCSEASTSMRGTSVVVGIRRSSENGRYSLWQEHAGHKKAVSYVVYMNNKELISASTDSSLRLWSIGDGKAIRSYAGHVNEKNFVGLSAEGDFVACGSETSQVSPT